MTTTVRRRDDLNTQIKPSPESISEWVQTELLKASRAEFVAVEKSVSFWKKQNPDFLAILTSLLVIRILRLNGWAIIPICLITIATTRKVISPTLSSSPVQKNSSLPYSVAFDVVHAIAGRIRFNVPSIAKNSQYAHQLEELLKADNQITSFRMNRDAASIVVNYNPNTILDSRMRSHLVSLLQSARDAVVMANFTTPSTILACSIEVRQATVSSDSCCLLKSKTGKPLKGGALGARSHRLYRLGILI
ncbi:HMA2 domain-containing protein [Scytonema sp. NUACC26]|uniref:HMA2 domain-containing protein n=1 Tax=Scytonema sp. NUACC26 TaxID=3140176 RepID=UPI0034DCB97D